MEIDHITYEGPKVDDAEIFHEVPEDFALLLRELNGFVLFGGGLHVRGACRQPEWHSIRSAWAGTDAFHELYPGVGPDDVPFGEDCVGDQYFLRAGLVIRLAAETGDIDRMHLSLFEFLEEAQRDPISVLQMQPLLSYRSQGPLTELPPGQLLSAYPPFCTVESAQGVSLRPVSALERRRYLADFAAKLGARARGF